MTEPTAATPGDRDRGRELVDVVAQDEAADRLFAASEHGGALPRRFRADVRAVLAALRDETERAEAALAAPAETEAGDARSSVKGRCPNCGHLTLFLGDGGHVTCSASDCDDPGMVDDLLGFAHRYGDRVRVARLAATPPAPEGEAGNLVRVSCGEHVATWVHEDEADEQPCPWCAARDATAAMDRANTRLVERTPAPAGPRAEGAGETAVLRQQLEEAHRKIAALHAVAYPDQSGRANGAPSGAGDDAAGGGDRS